MKLFEEIKKKIACDSVGKSQSALDRAVCLSLHPGKMLLFPFLHWFEYHYKNRYKFARLIYCIDLLLIGIVLALTVVAIYTTIASHRSINDQIIFSATIAPREVITGAPSTLVIAYQNDSNEELKNAKFDVTPPKHFLLEGKTHFVIGAIPPHSSRTIHVKGVMFGDVGGEQAFQSKLVFTYGKNSDQHGEKSDLHIFSPVRSALNLSLILPKKIIAYQAINGILEFENTGQMDFPSVTIAPQWPKGFVLTSSDIPLVSGTFEIPPVKAHEKGIIHFNGILQESEENVTFVFHPSFAFGNDRYAQETLSHIAPVVQLPLKLSHTVDTAILRPGTDTTFTIEYKNITETAILNVSLDIESNDLFENKSATKIIERILPNEEGTIVITKKLRSMLPSSVHQSLLSQATATFTLDAVSGQRAISKSARIDSRITTPIQFESFAKYHTDDGDQIGRGPIPPRVGEETTYWVFWHVDDTTNELKNLRVEGSLPLGVRFTERQTISSVGSISVDEKTNSIVWTASLINPTATINSQIVGVAFELGVTPTQTSPSPTLLKDIRLTATDDWTGVFVSASASDISDPS